MSLYAFFHTQKGLSSRRFPASSSELACEADGERQMWAKSGRRDSNPRQPAWKRSFHKRLSTHVWIGQWGRLSGFTEQLSTPDKRFRRRKYENLRCFWGTGALLLSFPLYPHSWIC